MQFPLTCKADRYIRANHEKSKPLIENSKADYQLQNYKKIEKRLETTKNFLQKAA